jgi:hypothetical protein
MLRVVRTEEHVVVEIKEEHNSESHEKDTYKKFRRNINQLWLRFFALVRLCLAQLFAGRFIRPEDVPVELHRSVQHLVRKERLQVISSDFCGVALDGSLGSFHSLKEAIWFKTAIDRWVNQLAFLMSK